MKTLLALLLLPILSWAGNIERHYCYLWMTTEDGVTTTYEYSKEDPYPTFYELNHSNKTFVTFSTDTGILLDEAITFKKKGTSYIVEDELVKSEIIQSKDDTSIIAHFSKHSDITFVDKCIPEAKYKSIFKEKEPIDTVNQCLDLGFKKGTEGLKNCVLELS